MSSSQPIICVPKRTHRVFRRTHRVCPKTFSPPKQYSRNSIPPVSYIVFSCPYCPLARGQDTKEYLTKSEGYLNRSFPGVKKGGIKGEGEEVRSGGRVNRARRGRRGKNEGKRVGRKGARKQTRKTLI